MPIILVHTTPHAYMNICRSSWCTRPYPPARLQDPAPSRRRRSPGDRADAKDIATIMATNTRASGWLRGKVKAVTSGDCLLIMGSTKAEIPPEKSITLSYLMAPRLARRGGVDEPFAWESREFLRKLCIGKEVTFRVDYTAPNVGQEFGIVYLGDKNIAYSVLAAGWARVKEQGPKGGEQSPYLAELQRLEEVAKQLGLGCWSKEPGAAEESIRDLPPSAIGESSGFDAKGFAVENKGKSLEAIVEQVRDGSTVRVYLLPSFQFVQIYVAGVQAPSMGRCPPNSTIVAETEGTTDDTVNGEDSVETPAPLTTAQRLAALAVSTEIPPDRFAREAKHFTEIRVLNRDVRIVVEGTDSFNNIIGSVYYPDGDTAKELALELVEKGLAKYVEWSASMLDVETKIKLKNAELQAKKEQLRIWTGFKPPVTNSKPILDQKFTGKVVEVVSGDCIIVADDAAPYGSPSAERRVNLSSIRAPEIGNPCREDNKPANFARESKEFLRTRLIGKQVTVEMEYSRRISTMDGQNAVPATNMADTRVLDYGSVFLGAPSQADGDDISSVPSSGNQPGVNVAELLLSRGFAQTSKHRDYEERSHYFDALLAAEARALKAKKGVHSSKDSTVMHITDLTMVSSNSPGLSFPTHPRRSPVASTMSDFRPPEHQVAGHRAAANKLGPLVDGAGLFFKPLQALDRGEHELAFYTAFSAHPAVPPRIRDTFFPRFHGTRLLPSPASPGESHLHLVLDDLLEGLASPSVIDIKIGANTWPPRAPEPYVAKCLAKDRASTSVLLGFRISGVRVADVQGAVWRPERSELKEMDIPDVRRVLRRYVSSVGGEGPDFAFAAAVYGGEGGVLAQLRELKAWFEGQTLFHFYSASVLLSYDANAVSVAGGGGAVRVKLVDFAHVVESEGVIDHNFLGGLCSLIKFIADIVAEASEMAPSGHS